MKPAVRLRRAALASACAALACGAHAFDNGLDVPTPPKPVFSAGGRQVPAAFLAGVNYPWLNHGWDFGRNAWGHKGVSSSESRKTVAADFAFLKSKGVKAARWFLFCDGRASPEFDDKGRVTGFDDKFFEDLDAALAIARENDVQLILVLFNFELFNKAKIEGGVQMGGRAALIEAPELQDSLFEKALNPLFDRYGSHPAVLAWEVMNEPELRMDGAVDPGAMHAFAKRVVTAAHARTQHLVTLGSVGRRELSRWTDIGLDFYQYHYYDYQEGGQPFKVTYASLKLDKPCILGEFPTKDTARSLETYLGVMRENGFAGALPWSLRAEDRYSDFRSLADRFAAWHGPR